MNETSKSLRTIFNEAMEIESQEEREAYLAAACGPDAGVRRNIEELIDAHTAAGGFLATRHDRSGNAATVLAAPPLEQPGDRIGHYKLREILGEGGCGVVYVAEQEEPVRRRVALKVIKPGMDSKSVIARFEAERQALALMDHPNIAKVLDAGATENGRPFFVMELVRGVRITDYCDQNKLSTRQRLDLFVLVCNAVQHAHQKGIIHRDLKPSNILVTVNDGVPVPKVIDFGIAKATEGRLTELTIYTELHQFIGTPAYMSPEQAEMTSLDIDTRTDIYSLGVLLYELLTGRTPFDPKRLLEAGLDEIRRTIREVEPPRPSTRLSTLANGDLATVARARGSEAIRLASLVRGDLDWIVMKALEKDRTRRYETPNNLAADIRRHLHNEPILARPPSTAYRARKFVRRNKLAVIAAGAVVLALALGLVASAWQAVRATRARVAADRAALVAQQAQGNEAEQRRQADASRESAQRSREQALNNLYIANLNLVQQDYEQGNLGRAVVLLGATRDNARRGFEWFYWQHRIHGDLRTFRGHTDVLRGVAISPDGRRVATASTDGSGRLWDADTGREMRVFAFPNAGSRAAAFSADGQLLAISGGDVVVLWDVERNREVRRLVDTNLTQVAALALAADGQWIALSGWNSRATNGVGDIALWDVVRGARLRTFGDAAGGVAVRLAFSPDNSRLFTAGFDGVARIWGVARGELQARLDAGAGFIWGGGFAPDGRRVVTAHWDGTARVWELATQTESLKLVGHTDAVYTACFTPDGRRLFTAGWDQQVRVWDARTGRALGQIPKGHIIGVISAEISADGRRLITGSWNGEAKLWDTDRLDETEAFRAPLWPEDRNTLHRFWNELKGPTPFLAGDSVNGLLLAPDTNHQVRVWDFATQQPRFVLAGHAARISAVAVSPDQARMVTGDWRGGVKIWDAATGKLQLSLSGHTNMVHTLSFSADGRRLVTASSDGVALVWEGVEQPSATLRVGEGIWAAASISPDGALLATGDEAGHAIVWDLGTARLQRQFRHEGPVKSVAWSPDGTRLATGGWDTVARLWEVSSGRLIVEFRGHRYPIWCVAFAPDGTRLVTGSMDKTAKVWDVASGRELLTLNGHAEDIHSVAFSADGRRIVTGSDDETVRIWESASEAEAARWHAEEEEAARRIEKARIERQTERAATSATAAADER